MNSRPLLNAQPTTPSWIAHPLAWALLYFPVCGLAALPFGGGGRYLSVLAGPLSLLFLFIWFRRDWRELATQAIHGSKPFLPLLGSCLLVVAVHPNASIGDPFSRVFWAAVIFVAATRLPVSRLAIFVAASLGACAYCLVAIRDVFILGVSRAGGDVNEIIFAETAMLSAGLALAGAFVAKEAPVALRLFLALSGGAGLAAVALSGSRGPLLAGFVLWLLLALHGWRAKRQLSVLIASAGVSVIIVATLLLTPMGDRALLAVQEVQSYFGANAFNPSSLGIRLELWRIGLSTLFDRPGLGYGYDTVPTLIEQLPALRVMPPDLLASLHHFHSDWIHALVAGGLVLVAGLALTIVLLGRQAGADLPQQWLLSAMLIFGVSDLAFFRKPTLTLFIAAWALLAASSRHEAKANSVHR